MLKYFYCYFPECCMQSLPHSDSSVQISLELPQFCFPSIFVFCYLLMLNPSPRKLRWGPLQLLFHSFHHCLAQGWKSRLFPANVSFRRSLTPPLLSTSLLPCLPTGFICLLCFLKHSHVTQAESRKLRDHKLQPWTLSRGSQLEVGWTYKLSQSVPAVYFLQKSCAAPSPIQHHRLENKCSNLWAYEEHVSLKPPQYYWAIRELLY